MRHDSDNSAEQPKLYWTQRQSEVSRPYAVVRDAYETYYANLHSGLTEDEIVDDFVSSYQLNDEGTPEALRAELQIEIIDWTQDEEIQT